MRTLGGEEPTQPGCRFSQKSGQIASKLKLFCLQVRYSPRASGTPLINAGGKGAVKICATNSNLSFRTENCPVPFRAAAGADRIAHRTETHWPRALPANSNLSFRADGHMDIVKLRGLIYGIVGYTAGLTKGVSSAIIANNIS